jgi:hypothetical protein
MTLKFIKDSPNRGYAYFECFCGHIKEIRADHVKYGKTKSCGCLHRKLASKRTKILHDSIRTHGMSKTNTYSTWSGMKARCFNTKNKFFHYYGGRGITVCDRWLDFVNFVADMGEKPSKEYSLDRIDNDGNYSPENCRWATKTEQMNNRRINRRLSFNGENLTISEWCKKIGVATQTIYNRIDLGWDVEKILSTEKHINKEGLSLGGKANGERNRAKTHCKRGHEFTPENTGKNGIDGRSCKKCHSIKEKERYAKKQKIIHS